MYKKRCANTTRCDLINWKATNTSEGTAPLLLIYTFKARTGIMPGPVEQTSYISIENINDELDNEVLIVGCLCRKDAKVNSDGTSI